MFVVSEPLVPLGAAFFPSSEQVESKSYAFVLLPEFTLLAFSAAIDPLRIANQLSQKPLYRWIVLSENGDAVHSSCGVSVNVDGMATSLPRDTTLFVCSGNLRGQYASRSTLELVKRHYQLGGAVGGICTGAFTLARAGILAGKTFTMHWENQPGFVERFTHLCPTVRKYEIDGRVLTCGGGAAATDLATRLISDDHGEEFATMVSDMCLKRAEVGTDTSQRTSLGAVLHTRNPGLISIVRLMTANFETPLTMPELANKVGYTTRHIERLFEHCIGTPPAKFYRNLRLDHARSLLADTEMSLFEISAACGFDSKSYFARAFKQRFGCPPSKFNYHRRGLDRT